MSAVMPVCKAYERCESITRREAANFYYGIRLLARERRLAMCAVYAFARRVDDIGDGPLEREEKLRRLEAEARALGELTEPGAGARMGSDAVMVALADVHVRFALPPGALGELIEGVRMDLDGVTYERFDDLLIYCRRVAGAIGRVCLAIFGARAGRPTRGPEAEALADDLGVAMQLTNILRDLREDAQNGRVYLPGEDLRRFALMEPGEEPGAPAVRARLLRASAGTGAHLDGSAQTARLQALVRFEADRAEPWFSSATRLAPLLDRRSAACVRAMAGIYGRLLGRIGAHPERALERRMSLPAPEKAWVAARSMLGGRP